MKTFAIAGCGHLGRIVHKAYQDGLLEGYTLVATYSLRMEDAEQLAQGTGAKVASSMDEVISIKPDYIVETASIALLKEFAVKALGEGIGIIPLSIGAFADARFKEEALKAADEGQSRIFIPSGAVGGFDILRTMALIADAQGLEIRAGIHTHKGPDSLRNTPLYDDALQNAEKTVFQGTTSQAIALLPTKVNVAVASALATIGPDSASAEITSVPGFVGDDHCITVETDGLKATVDIYSATSDIAAWSVVALMRNLSSRMMFF